MRTTPILLMLCALFVQCATLDPVAANVCGNGVLEAGEDCDSTEKSCGGPSTGVQACHFTCTTTADCAAGASCSADGVCRTPAGTFSALTGGVSANVTTLLVGDFDGDKHTDIIGSPPYGSAGSSRVLYFDSSNALTTTTPLDLPIPLGTVKDLTKDGIDDIGFAIRNLGFGAFGALSGRTDRSFATVLYPAVTFTATAASWTVVTNNGTSITLPGSAPSCAFGLLNGADTGSVVASICDGSTGSAGALDLKVPLLPTDLVGDPQAGAIDALAIDASTCGHVVFATKSLVYLLPLCNAQGWQNVTPHALDPHLKGDTIASLYVGSVRSLVTDDILIRTTNGATLVYDKDVLTNGGFEAPTDGLGAEPLPLASGDLNGDGAVDFVFPNGILLAPPTVTGTATRVAPRDNLAWKYAKIGRFNDDELPDVLVSFDGQLDVDVLGNAGDGRFTPFTVRTDQIVRGIGAGDFDGDRIDDVAFLQATDQTDNAPADLFIAFGSATGAPEAAQLVGSLKSAHALVTLRDSSIGVDDLSVVGTAMTTGDSSVTVLFGTGGRTQVAPLFMLDTSTSTTAGKRTVLSSVGGGKSTEADATEAAHYWQPASFSIGPFIQAGTTQIVSIAAGFDYTPSPAAGQLPYTNFSTAAWYAPQDLDAVGDLDPFQLNSQLGPFVSVDLDALQAGKFELRSVTAAGDIDYPVAAGMEVDELVTLTKALSDPTAASVFVVRPNPQGTVPLPAAIIPNAVVDGSDPIQIVDINGDHKPDVVFILTADNVRKLMIMLGDGEGGFAAPTAVAVPTDAETFAAIQTGGAHLQLAIITPTKVLLASLDGVVDISPNLGPSYIPNYTGIAVGDFNGDGVNDIALAESGSVRLLPQKFVGQHE